MKTLVLNLSEAELKENFYILQNRQDISKLLEVSDYQLRYHLYIHSLKSAYTEL